MSQLNQGLTLFLSLLVEATPFLLLGVAFSSLLAILVDERKLIAYTPKNPVLAAIAGSLFGCVFPVCECGNVPVARRLLMQGAPSALAIGFLLAAPTVNPIVFWATWVAFRDQPAMVFWRVGLTILVSVIIACIFSVQKDLRPFLQPTIARYLPAPATQPEPALVGSGSTLLQGGRLSAAINRHPQARSAHAGDDRRGGGAATAVLAGQNPGSPRNDAPGVSRTGGSIGHGQCDRRHGTGRDSPRVDFGPRTRPHYFHSGHDAARVGRLHLLHRRFLFLRYRLLPSSPVAPSWRFWSLAP